MKKVLFIFFLIKIVSLVFYISDSNNLTLTNNSIYTNKEKGMININFHFCRLYNLSQKS